MVVIGIALYVHVCISIPKYIMLRNLSDLDFDLSRSLTGKCDSVVGIPIYDFPLLFNNNIWPILASLRDLGFQNLECIDIEFSRSLRSNVTILFDYPYIWCRIYV